MKEKQDNDANRLHIKEYVKSYTDSLKQRQEATKKKKQEDTEFRICTRCGSTRLIDYFERNRKGELFESCSDCRNIDKRYYDNHKEEQKAYRDLMREQLKEKYRLYGETHKEEIKERNIIYREANKEQIKEYHNNYDENHKEQKRAQKKHI